MWINILYGYYTSFAPSKDDVNLIKIDLDYRQFILGEEAKLNQTLKVWEVKSVIYDLNANIDNTKMIQIPIPKELWEDVLVEQVIKTLKQ